MSRIRSVNVIEMISETNPFDFDREFLHAQMNRLRNKFYKVELSVNLLVVQQIAFMSCIQ